VPIAHQLWKIKTPSHVCFHCSIQFPNLKLRDKLGVSLSAERLRALNRGTESTVNDELRKDTEGTGNTEEDGIVVGLSKAIVLEKDTGVLFEID
jgi:hypothetical protein